MKIAKYVECICTLHNLHPMRSTALINHNSPCSWSCVSDESEKTRKENVRYLESENQKKYPQLIKLLDSVIKTLEDYRCVL